MPLKLFMQSLFFVTKLPTHFRASALLRAASAMGSGSQAALEATHRRAFGARPRVVSVKQEHFIPTRWSQGLYTAARRTLRRQTQPSNRWRVSLHLLLVVLGADFPGRAAGEG